MKWHKNRDAFENGENLHDPDDDIAVAVYPWSDGPAPTPELFPDENAVPSSRLVQDLASLVIHDQQ